MITPRTIARFLVGKRDAIEQIASSRSAFFLAALFIVSAGLARNYDHHILVREPLWIFGPFAMTFFSSFFIFGFVKSLGGLNRGALKSLPTPSSNYFPFLRCFAMTAPLAWLYGIPVEQLTTALVATQFNFAVLLIVSFWRLILMMRVIIVLFNFNPLRAFCLISIPASFEMFFATFIKSVSIVGIMGGMKLTTAESFLYKATQAVTAGSLFLFIAACLLIFFSKRGEIRKHPPVENTPKVSRPTWIVAVTTIALWLVASSQPQKRLRNLAKFQNLIKERQYQEAQAFTGSINNTDFPPHRRLFGKTSRYQVSQAAITLANHKTWPDWIQKELEEEVQLWLEDLDEDGYDYRLDMLRERIQGAPHVEEFARKFTPNHDLRYSPAEEPETSPPTKGDDHSQ
ncbi:MAG: hypothetical protein P1U90_10360 [Akkermansiaceae bacterium]|nr:hypothetical protein [Akkermansiaceae bacterium]